jgi:cell division septation protein DedD
MSKSDEYREMQISSGQLAAVILVLLALCVFVFYLGTRVGMKKAEAASPVTAANSAVQIPITSKPAPPVTKEPAGNEAKPAETKVDPATVESGKPQTSEAAKPKTAENKPQPKTETKPLATETKAAPPSGTYYIQAGALDTRPKAETMAQKIEGLGFRAIVLNPLAGDKKTVYRVRVGPYETKESAETAKGKLAEALKRKATDFFLIKG